MLSPATPLTLAFLAAFVLLLLSTLSTPVIPSIHLGNYEGYNLGVFGYCSFNGTCSPVKVGYNTTTLWPSGTAPDNLNPSTRANLSFVLIVHPIAAFLVLICTILAGAAHLPSPGHSSRYLLGLLILTFPTLLVTLLAFLVDILLFIPPHMSWGGWIVLPATLIITACSVVTCAMRRTLVSRKKRKERIEKNEDMNGSAYYAMKQDTQFSAPQQSYARAESPPPLPPSNNGSNTAVAQEKAAGFGTYDFGGSRPSTDDRSPLNARDPSIHTNGSGRRRDGNMSGSTFVPGAAGSDPTSPVNYDERSTPGASFDSRSRSARGGPGYARGGPPPQPYSRGRGGPPRGPRGAPPYPPHRGGYSRSGPRGPPPPGWNGYGRGGAPPMRGRGGPPPGYPGPYYGGAPPPGPDGGIIYPSNRSLHGRASSDRQRDQWPAQEEQFENSAGDWDLNDTQVEMDAAAMADSSYAADHGRSRSQPSGPAAPAYEARSESRTRDPASFGFSGRVPSPARSLGTPRNNSPPPPVPSFPGSPPGQAVEMDTLRGSPKPYNAAQPGQAAMAASQGDPSGGTYAARSIWQPEAAELGNRTPPARYASPAAEPAANINSRPTTPRSRPATPRSQHRPRTSNDGYYEDMDPRFSEDTERPPIPTIETNQYHHQDQSSTAMPSSLMPGGPAVNTDNQYPPYRNQPADPNTLYPSYGSASHHPADIRDDYSRSPAISEDEGSNFTSISQRGVNPDWQPSSSAPQPDWRDRERERERDQMLTTNPDFAVPGAGPGSRFSANRGVPASGHVRGLGSSGGSHRYPDAM